MTTKQLERQYTTTTVERLKKTDEQSRLGIWRAVRGMWKRKKVDPVRYQRKLRDEADHVAV